MIQRRRSGGKQELVQREAPRRLAPFPSQAEILSLLNSSLLGQRLSAFSFSRCFLSGVQNCDPLCSSDPLFRAKWSKCDQRDIRMQKAA